MKKLYFLTSSRTKLEHAKYLAKKFDVSIEPRRDYGKVYIEPRIQKREILLKSSFDDALRRWKKRKHQNYLFFIEDTSVIIDALSTEREIPGVDIKYWMQESTFENLDTDLRALGNNRKATVRSDVLLYLSPEVQKALGRNDNIIQFTGMTKGSITENEIEIKTHPIFSWLDHKSFNKWFVPAGESKPLSALPQKSAEIYDIRKESIGSMLEFLERNNLINARVEAQGGTETQQQMEWHRVPLPQIILVCGLPCAGKTTLGEYLSNAFQFYHIEASDFMRMARNERHGVNPPITIDEFADAALKESPGIVVNKVLSEILKEPDHAIVITGFRALSEITIFQAQYNQLLPLNTLFIDADSNIRFQRGIDRGRAEDPQNLDKFCERDQLQLDMGLDKIKDQATVNIIKNIYSLEDFYTIIQARIGLQESPHKNNDYGTGERPASLEATILVALLLDESAPENGYTTTEIARVINKQFSNSSLKTNKNNVSRYFNMRFYPYFRLLIGTPTRYLLSQTGRTRAMIFLRRLLTNGNP